jgi:hypothetical protein
LNIRPSIERSSFHWALYFQVNGSYGEGTPPRCCSISLDKPTSWLMVVSIAARTTSSAPVLMMCNRLFPTHLHKLILKNIKQFLFKKRKHSTTSLIYGRLPKNFKPANTKHVCHKLVHFIQFLLTIKHNSIS